MNMFSRFAATRHSVLSRLASILIAVTIIANLVIILIWNYNVHDIVNRMALSHISDIIKNSNSKFGKDIFAVTENMQNLAADPSVTQFRADGSEAAKQELLAAMGNYYNILSDRLNGIAFVSKDTVLSIGLSYFPQNTSDYLPPLSDIFNSEGNTVIFKRSASGDLPIQASQTISVCINIDSSEENPLFLIADLNRDFLISYFGISNMNGILRTVIVNNDTIMFSNEQNISAASIDKLIKTSNNNNFNNFFEIELDGESYTAMTGTIAYMPMWQNITFFQTDYMYNSYYKTVAFILWFIAFVIIAALTVSIAYSLSVTKRFNILSKKIENINIVNTGQQQELLSAAAAPVIRDEIDMIEQKFLSLMSTISYQINEITDIEQKSHEYEIESLRAQINPHFIYNALTVIQTLADMQSADNISEITQALSHLLRYSVTDSDRFVTLRDEIAYLKNYMTIMQNKFLNRIALNFDIEDRFLDCIMLKMTLQPIIENSLRHAFEDKPANYIMLKANETDYGISIKVLDNGCGIPQEKLVKLLDYSINDGQHLGLRNLDRRIKIIFGEDYGLSISSSPGVYTSVSIEIPFMTKEENDND